VRIQLGGTPMSRAEIRVARASGEWAAGNKTTGFCPLSTLKMIILPRQARDKQRKKNDLKHTHTHTPVFLQGLEGCLCSGSLARISERGCSHRSLSKLQRVRRWRWRRDGSWSVLLAGYSSGFCAMQRCVSASIHSPKKRSERGPPKPYLFFDRNSHHLIQKMCIDLARTKSCRVSAWAICQIRTFLRKRRLSLSLRLWGGRPARQQLWLRDAQSRS
jgi:hypothetical protein